ncbi:hypothetical protein BU24DRAFT_399713 [Aaosphaeria arxii CBS 175.79]|uniref:Tat pathway signal sequence n=1 Tax=Aaosphaeria arxii CBS 175.79 TaxID=1450172 RepID=A0A6A5XBR4_9PLEO|nr:uncharacterized protein BU24DRAFT_399713 [Aaosphaeria arxii CBS 175.79]KAF2010398.1 hypothetical protein BU24DRAFT_399713 [Aaosphaeria arxii CBS 175.79]
MRTTQQYTQRDRYGVFTFFYLSTGLLVTSILILLFGAIGSLKGTNSGHTGFDPILPETTSIFARDPKFADPFSPHADEAWNSIMPEGRGFVLVDDPKKYGYRKGVPTEKGDRYSVSVFHQIHCLGMIRASYYKGNGTAKPIGHLEGDLPADILEEVHEHHIAHCFDYLRQALMCSADTTIEWAVVQSTGERRQVDGWGVPHKKCKDWNVLMAWMNEHKAPSDYSGIL